MRVFCEVLGAEVEVPEKPERVVSLAENLTEALFMLELGDRVVGVSTYCRRPREAGERPGVGGYLEASRRTLKELRPDLILTTTGVQLRLAKRLHGEGYPVYPIPLPKTLHGIIENVLELGLVMDAVEKARSLASKLTEKLWKTRGTGGRRVYVELELGGPITVGASSYLSHAFSVIGAKNVYDHVKTAYFQPRIEEVVNLNPDVIIYDPPPRERDPAGRLRRMVRERGWERMEAVKNGRIYATEGDVLAHYGPSFILETLPWLARITR